MNKDEVRAEHLRAMARLDEEQIQALKRINAAFRNTRFGNTSLKEAMNAIFEAEARHRSGEGPPPAHLDLEPDVNDMT